MSPRRCHQQCQLPVNLPAAPSVAGMEMWKQSPVQSMSETQQVEPKLEGRLDCTRSAVHTGFHHPTPALVCQGAEVGACDGI